MRGRPNDLAGKRFGRLTALNFTRKEKNRHYFWNCECDCGNKIFVESSHLINGHTQSCGCIKKEMMKGNKLSQTHGAYKLKLYSIWEGMKQRCNNPQCDSFGCYGGRGIRICAEWNDFQKFQEWALSNGYKEGLSIDRIDNDGNYSPENCQWLTRAENASKGNRRVA